MIFTLVCEIKPISNYFAGKNVLLIMRYVQSIRALLNFLN